MQKVFMGHLPSLHHLWKALHTHRRNFQKAVTVRILQWPKLVFIGSVIEILNLWRKGQSALISILKMVILYSWTGVEEKGFYIYEHISCQKKWLPVEMLNVLPKQYFCDYRVYAIICNVISIYFLNQFYNNIFFIVFGLIRYYI